MKTGESLSKGDQIAYVPMHAKSNLMHPDVEFGFVMGPAGGNAYFCRYWLKDKPGKLRTVANSEATPSDSLVKFRTTIQSMVNDAIRAIESDGEA